MYIDNRARRITVVIMIVAAALLIGWDVVVSVNDGQGDTISEIVNDWAYYSLTIPLVCGMLIGHWFIPLGIRDDEWPKWVFCAIASFVLVDLLAVCIRCQPYPVWSIVASAISGVIYGSIVWSLRKPENG